MSLIAGVDEAGRGAVIGPLVVCGVVADESRIEKLQTIGVRDSKLLTPKRREELSVQIRKIVLKEAFEKLSPARIDEAVLHGGKYRRLNYLEMAAMARVIQILRPTTVFLDPCDVSPQRCIDEICSRLPFKTAMVCEYGADRIYTVVSAASILAKVERDRAVSELRATHGDFGSGYPSDQKTILFLKKELELKRRLPSFIRSSWATVRRLKTSS